MPRDPEHPMLSKSEEQQIKALCRLAALLEQPGSGCVRELTPAPQPAHNFLNRGVQRIGRPLP